MKRAFGSRPAKLMIALFSSAIATAVFLLARDSLDQGRHREFRDTVGDLTHHVEDHIGATVQQLRSIRLPFDASLHVNADEFQILATGALDASPWIHAMEWAPAVQAAAIDQHIAEARNSGSPFYRDPGDDSARAPPFHLAPRPDYRIRSSAAKPGIGSGDVLYPVVYIEPANTNTDDSGFDLASDPSLFAAILEASNSGGCVMVAPTALAQGPEAATAMRLVAVVREQPASSASYSGSRVLGALMVVVRYADLFQHALGVDPQFAKGINFRLVDLTDAEPQILHALDDGTGPTTNASGDWAQHPLTVAGRQLRIEAAPTASWIAARSTLLPLFLAALFGAVALLLGYCLAWSKGHAERRAAQQRDKILGSVLTSLSEGVVVADREANILFCNSVALQLLGPIEAIHPLQWPSVCGLYLEDARTPFPAEQVPLVRAMHGERVFLDRMYLKNDEHPGGIWLNVSGSPLLDENDRLQGGIAVIRDVSIRQQFEMRLQRMSAVVEQTADFVFVVDHAGRILQVNPAFEVRTGWPAAEVVGQKSQILSADSHEDVLVALCAGLEAGSTLHDQTSLRTKDGTLLQTEFTITAIQERPDRGPSYVVVCHAPARRSNVNHHDMPCPEAEAP